MPLRIDKITVNNWKAAVDLKTSEDHKKFVAPNVYSIAQAQFYNEVTAYGIFYQDQMIGFTMYGVVPKSEDNLDDRFWIWRLMIDEDHRGKGFGRGTMNLIIEEAKSLGHKYLVLSTEPENHKGIKLYESLDFKATGIINDGEEEYVLTL